MIKVIECSAVWQIFATAWKMFCFLFLFFRGLRRQTQVRLSHLQRLSLKRRPLPTMSGKTSQQWMEDTTFKRAALISPATGQQAQTTRCRPFQKLSIQVSLNTLKILHTSRWVLFIIQHFFGCVGVSALKKGHHLARSESCGSGGSPSAQQPQLYSSTPGSNFNKSKRFNRYAKTFVKDILHFQLRTKSFSKIFTFVLILSRTAIKRGGSQKTLNESRLVWAINDVDEDDLRVCESTFYLQVNNTLIKLIQAFFTDIRPSLTNGFAGFLCLGIISWAQEEIFCCYMGHFQRKLSNNCRIFEFG